MRQPPSALVPLVLQNFNADYFSAISQALSVFPSGASRRLVVPPSPALTLRLGYLPRRGLPCCSTLEHLNSFSTTQAAQPSTWESMQEQAQKLGQQIPGTVSCGSYAVQARWLGLRQATQARQRRQPATAAGSQHSHPSSPCSLCSRCQQSILLCAVQLMRLIEHGSQATTTREQLLGSEQRC